LAGVLLPVAVVGVLSGCSSSSGGDKAQPKDKATAPTAPATSESASASSSQGSGGVHGHLDYAGSRSGGFDVTTSVGCATLDGRLVAVNAPAPDDTSAPTVPSFVANIGSENMATLVTPDKHTFVKLGADGLSGAKQGGDWTVTVAGTELGAVDASGGSVTVNGHLTCTKVSGT
jgi:hypothetical protein